MKILLQRLGLVLLGLAAAWLLVEAIARFAGLAAPPQLGTNFDRSPALFFSEPERLHPWSSTDGDVFRIAVIGDSFTVGEGVQRDDAYPARLERLLNLNANTTPVEVRTYARSGTSTRVQRRFLRRAVANQPDLIILGVFLNDSETFKMGRWRRELQPRVPSGWRLRLLQTSRSLAWLYQRLEERRIGRSWMQYMHRLYEPEFAGWKQFNGALKSFANTCRAAEIPLVAIVLPPAGALGPEYPFEFAHEKIHEALKGQGIPYFDLLDVFRGRSGLRLSVLPGVDGHFNEIGNRMVAEAVFGYLLRQGHIPAAYNPRQTEPQPAELWLRRLRKAKSVLPP